MRRCSHIKQVQKQVGVWGGLFSKVPSVPILSRQTLWRSQEASCKAPNQPSPWSSPAQQPTIPMRVRVLMTERVLRATEAKDCPRGRRRCEREM